VLLFRLDIADTSLNLVNNLSSQLIELETRLASQTSFLDDENSIHRQLTDLNELNNHLLILEKSVTELLKQSKQLNNERLIRISEQLTTRWKQIISEINQRKRFILQMIESHQSFKTLFEKEEHILNNIEKRMQILEPISNDTNKLRRMAKTVTV
jgi:hypothetical protein